MQMPVKYRLQFFGNLPSLDEALINLLSDKGL